MELLHVTYLVEAVAEEIEAIAESLLLEQTVETPREVAIRHPYVRAHMLGAVEGITQQEAGSFRVTLSLPLELASESLAQFLNVVFGNCSLLPGVELLDVQIPAGGLPWLRGPHFGIGGVREAAQVSARPLTMTALKPAGLTTDEIAALCHTFALGGIDLIKDDHYLSDHARCPFEERVRACLAATARAAERSGRRSVYVPNLSGKPTDVRRRATFALEAGAQALMIAPMLMGLPAVAELLEEIDVPVLLHPSFGGAQRVAPPAFYGRLMRLLGGDMIIFPSYGGRFSYSAQECEGIAQKLREPWAGLKAALPVPAGGMSVERLPELRQFYGNDVAFLVGGSLLQAGERLLERTQQFTGAIAPS